MGVFDKNKFDSVKQDWATSWDFFRPLMDEFNFTLDAAADMQNKKVERYYGVEQNGLSQSWENETVWCNPPYGRDVPNWLKKGIDEAKRGCISCFLIPARTNTRWFHDLCLQADEVRFVKGRPKFYNYASDDIEATHGLPVPLCVVIYRPNISTCRVGTYDWRKKSDESC
jgi:site-specific DNA-methyltransferase (adenine-specific)